MKTKFTPIYTTLFLLIILILFLGNSASPDFPNNPPNGRTGAPGDYGLCTACHTPGNPLGFDGEVIIENFPTDIAPDTDYSLTVRVTNPNGLAFRAGFQAVVLDASDNNSGDLTTSGSNPTTQFEAPLNREYVEHNPAINFGGGTEVAWDFTWTSPTGPSGEMITIYAVGNIASGGNGNQQDLIVTSTASGTMMNGGGPLDVEIISSQNVSCNGGNDGSATASASGGTMPYVYNWSNGSNGATANNLSAGSYTVTVTDDLNATATAMVSIMEPSLLVATIVSQTDIDCNNPVGSATVAGSGGIPPYTFSWSSGGTDPTETFLNPGTYTVTVLDNNLCVKTTTVDIIEDTTLPSTNAGTDGQLDCNTPILVLSGSPSGPPYALLWTTIDGNIVSGETTSNPTVDAAGTYTLTVTDQSNGCTSSDDVLVTEIEDISLLITGNDVTCFGGNDGSINLTVTGGQGPYDYDWNDDTLDGIEDPTGLTAGTYSVTVTDNNGCLESTSIEIFEPASITITEVITNISCFGICDGAIDISINGGSSPYNFNWAGPNGYSSNEQNISDLCAGEYTVTVTDDNGCTSTLTANVIEPSEIIITGTVSNVSCNGVCDGSIDISVSGGISPYTFVWDDPANQTTEDISDLCAGDYTVTVTDANGCTSSATFSITEPAELILSATSSNISCNGICDGSIDLTISGGTPGYSIAWSNGSSSEDIDNLCAETYTVTVTDTNGCTEVFSQIIAEPDALDLQLSSTNETTPGANDGTATAEVSGGTPGYAYLWDDPNSQNTSTAVDLAPGTYCVTVTDNNDCTVSGCVVVNAGNCDLMATVSTTNVSCNDGNDGEAEAIPNGGTMPYNYNWSSGGNEATENNLSAGSYSVTITDANDCEVIVDFDISEPPPLVLDLTSTDETTNGAMDGTATANITGGTPAYTYLWDDPNNSTTQMIENLAAGNYCVTITDLNGCTISGCVAVNPGGCDLEAEIATQNVSCNGGNDGSATVIASGGTPPYTYDWSSGGNEETEINLSAGSYMVTIFDSNGCCIILNFEISEPTLIQGTTTTTNLLCNGICDGSINLEIIGGDPPYSFEWSNGGSEEDIENLCAGTYTVTITENNGCTITAEATVTEPPALQLNVTSTDETAEGADDGTATAEVMGGTPGFNYIWPDNQTTQTAVDLSPGTYCVTVTDNNGCTISGCTVVNPFGCDISLEISNNNFTCIDNCNGMIDLTVNGGEEPFNYEWNDTLIGNNEDPENLCTGTYSVTVTDNNGCSVTISTNIEDFPEMALSSEISSASCFGLCDGFIDLTVDGGAPPFAFNWSNGDTVEDPSGLCAEEYTVTVTDDNGCTAVISIIVGEPDELLATAIPTDASCFEECDGSVDFVVTGGTPPYSLSGPLEMLCAGTYSITATDENGCTTSFSFEIEEPNEIEITVDEIGHEMNAQNDGFVNVSVVGGTMPYSYNWMLNGSTVSNDEDPTGLAAGIYTLKVTDANGCVVPLEEIIVDNIVRIIDPDLKKVIDIFPNPTNGLVQIKFDLKDMQIVEIEVFDFSGKGIIKLQKRNVLNQKLQLDLSKFSEGVYTLKINIGNTFLIERIVKHD